MTRDDIIRMATEAGITPWAQLQWVGGKFVDVDEGMDGDIACLMQFADLVAAAERKAQEPRQWQGLTDKELEELSDADLGAYDLCLEVEAKLKEKNT